MKSYSHWITLRALAVAFLASLCVIGAHAQDKTFEDKLGPGDTIKVQVFQNPDLTLETRILETGIVTYPLIGSARLAGSTIPEAEKILADALKQGGFVQQPQVNIILVQARKKQVSVLGAVGRPGQFPLENTNTRLSEVLALAGGITAAGSDVVIVTGSRDGKSFRREVDVTAIYLEGKASSDMVMAGGDSVYVHRAPMFYIYGEAQRPGSYRIERGMTVMQALVIAGGPTARGTEKRLKLHRPGPDGSVKELTPELRDLVQPDDVIFVRESLF